MNRRSLFKALLGATAGAAVPAVATAKSACRLENKPTDLEPFKFHKTWSDGPYIWKGVWTGWKSCYESANLYGQAVALPSNPDGSVDVLRPWIYYTSGGRFGVYQKGQNFDLSHVNNIPIVTALTPRREKNVIAADACLNLMQVIRD